MPDPVVTPTSTPTPSTPAPSGTPTSPDTAPGGTDPSTLIGEPSKPAPANGVDAKTLIPEKYDIKVPDGMELDQSLFDKFTPLAREAGLDGPKAQQFADLYVQAVKGTEEKAIQAMVKQSEDWVAQVKADKDIGGSNFDQSMKYVQKGVEFCGGDAFRKEINDLGIGAFPPLVKALAKIGRHLGEDTISGTSPTPGGQKGEQDILAQRYPVMAKILNTQG